MQTDLNRLQCLLPVISMERTGTQLQSKVMARSKAPSLMEHNPSSTIVFTHMPIWSQTSEFRSRRVKYRNECVMYRSVMCCCKTRCYRCKDRVDLLSIGILLDFGKGSSARWTGLNDAFWERKTIKEIAISGPILKLDNLLCVCPYQRSTVEEMRCQYDVGNL